MANANSQAVDPNAQNGMARALVLQRSIDMTQSIYSGSVSSPKGAVVNIPLRNVGLIKRLWVEISFTLAQAASETLTRTKWGPANILSNITLTDLSNQTRINTTGWHLSTLASVKRQTAFGAAYTSDTPMGFAANFAVISAPSSITTGQTVRMFYEIPLAYGDYDLRGAIYASVVNATMNLQMTINNNLVVASTGNPTQAAYISSSTDLGAITNFNINVYQNYLDQIPMVEGGPVLPLLDLSTAYLLNNTVVTGLVTNQDMPIPYANFREFLSTMVIYDNFGSSTAIGAETNYWSIQSANYTNILKYDPYLSSLLTRNVMNDDMPAEVARPAYYFDHRRKPISTIQYGNMQLIGNFAHVQNGSTSQLLVGYEQFALINMITGAGSLYAN